MSTNNLQPEKPPGDPPQPVAAGPGGTGGGSAAGASWGHDSPDAPPLSQAAAHLFDPGTLWDVVVQSGEADADEDLEWQVRLTQDKEMRAAMNLRALGRLRDELDRIPGNAAPGDPVTLRASDAVLLARMLLSRLS